MDIPTKFKIFGYNWSIVFDDERCQRKQLYGSVQYNEQVVYLCHKYNGTKRHPEAIKQTFFHEIVHIIFFYLNENKLEADEKLIDNIASCLTQIIESFDYSVITIGSDNE